MFVSSDIRGDDPMLSVRVMGRPFQRRSRQRSMPFVSRLTLEDSPRVKPDDRIDARAPVQQTRRGDLQRPKRRHPRDCRSDAVGFAAQEIEHFDNAGCSV